MQNLRSTVRGLSQASLRSFAQVSSTRPAAPTSLSDEKDEHFARMLMFGKPGAGKGTLTTRLLQKYDIFALSTGDLLRRHIADRTEVGKEAEAIIARGELVPDEVVLKVLTSKLNALQNKVNIGSHATWFIMTHTSMKHWILDGFPRTLRQGELLDQHLK